MLGSTLIQLFDWYIHTIMFHRDKAIKYQHMIKNKQKLFRQQLPVS